MILESNFITLEANSITLEGNSTTLEQLHKLKIGTKNLMKMIP